MFVALCRNYENKYCLFTFETSRLSCVGLFAKNNVDRLLTESNPNLHFVDKEMLERQVSASLLAHKEPMKSVFIKIQATMQLDFIGNEVKTNAK